MQVFISWSGERSRTIAEVLRQWLPRAMQSVRPWMSKEDLSAGSRWLAEVSNLLDTAGVGILCITPENQHNPWLLFEAGALSKSLDQSRVCPLLFDMTTGQLSGPITQFQAQILDKPGVFRLLTTLNSLLPDGQMPDAEISEILDVWWPHLQNQLDQIAPITPPAETRSTQAQLDELLSLARENIRRENIRLEANKERDEKMEGFFGLMNQSMSVMNSMDKTSRQARGKFKAIDAMMQKALEQGGPSDDDVTQMMEMLQPPIDASSMKVDLGTLKAMQDAVLGIHESQKRHVQKIISPAGSSEDSEDPKS